jgi:hypothetical protein
MTERNVKKVLEVKEIEENLIMIKLEATKRRKVWLKRIKGSGISCCDQTCPLYYECPKMKSPLTKYPNFGEFCNNLFNEYPDLSFRLATEYGITNINQVVPIKKRR